MRSRFAPHAADLCRTSLLLSLAAGLTLQAAGAARADTATLSYTGAPIVSAGDAAGNVAIPSRSRLFVGGLSDTGQILFSAGALDQSQPELLLQSAGGQFTTIVAPPAALISPWAGDVAWPRNIALAQPISTNGRGSVVFTATTTYGGSPWGTFRWDPTTGHTTTLATKGMPAPGHLTFALPGGFAPAINSSDEVALIGWVKDANNKAGYGLFRLGRDGVMELVARPHESLDPWEPEGGGKISLDQNARPSINDMGAIAFLAHPDGTSRRNAYLWEHGSVTPLLKVGDPGPNGSKITAIAGVFLNSRNHDALVVATTDQKSSNRFGLYRVRNGKTEPVAAPGDTLPGGGNLQTIQYQYPPNQENTPPFVAVSEANSLGQFAFQAVLEDGSQAAYRMDTNGSLALILNGGAPARPVHIMAVARRLTFVPGSRPSINRRGQIALSGRYEGGSDTVMLMTPQYR